MGLNRFTLPGALGKRLRLCRKTVGLALLLWPARKAALDSDSPCRVPSSTSSLACP